MINIMLITMQINYPQTLNRMFIFDKFLRNLEFFILKFRTRGRGKTAPPVDSYETIDGEVKVPAGEGKPTNLDQVFIKYYFI
jgi:hypothetical protein